MDIVVPDFDLPGIPLTICSWLVAPGERVYEGDRVLEILADEVTIDIGAPATGVLVEQLATEDEAVAVGQVVGRVDVDSEPSPED
jgi:pyruvate/2-oxoglutarate dehydrogenase complex dihydrolipoamide acyltransferase (E2) component